jgi:hypothetical protein
MAGGGGRVPETLATVVVIIVAVLAAWAALRFVARVVAGVVLAGLLLAGLLVLAGRATGQPPAAVVGTVVTSISAEATRTRQAVPAWEDLGRADRMGRSPAPAATPGEAGLP